MMTVSEVALALVFGMGFGWALHKARLGEYATIAGVFRFKDLTVLKFMMTALCVAMIGVYALNEFGLITMNKVNETYLVGNLAGGLIFGIGMAVAGF